MARNKLFCKHYFGCCHAVAVKVDNFILLLYLSNVILHQNVFISSGTSTSTRPWTARAPPTPASPARPPPRPPPTRMTTASSTTWTEGRSPSTPTTTRRTGRGSPWSRWVILFFVPKIKNDFFSSLTRVRSGFCSEIQCPIYLYIFATV